MFHGSNKRPIHFLLVRKQDERVQLLMKENAGTNPILIRRHVTQSYRQDIQLPLSILHRPIQCSEKPPRERERERDTAAIKGRHIHAANRNPISPQVIGIGLQSNPLLSVGSVGFLTCSRLEQFLCISVGHHPRESWLALQLGYIHRTSTVCTHTNEESCPPCA